METEIGFLKAQVAEIGPLKAQVAALEQKTSPLVYRGDGDLTISGEVAVERLVILESLESSAVAINGQGLDVNVPANFHGEATFNGAVAINGQGLDVNAPANFHEDATFNE